MAEQEHGRFSIVPARAYDAGALPDGALRVLGILGTYSDKDGWCFPSQGTLATRAGLERPTVVRNIGILVERGFITKTNRQRPNGSNTSCLYRIIFDSFDSPPLEYVNLPDQKSKEPEAPKVNKFPIAVALSKCCKMNLEMNKGRLLKEAKTLETSASNFTLELLEAVYGPEGYWYQVDFRGRKGDPPTSQQILQTWERYTELYNNDSDIQASRGDIKEGFID